ncbi:MAG: BatA domain-containing protein, partial [Chloroflexi bacterium]|nr:BatA domain-containing protein [Chloroflexota bacterium]
MTWAAPLAFAWLALMVLVGLFYLLRPKRQRVAVASLLLWRRTLQRERDESWLDWLKRHLLLILQLLLVAALALALARP